VEDFKIEKAADYPYTGQTDICNDDPQKGLFNINRYKYVPHNDLDQLAAAAAQQPIGVSVSVGTDWRFYSSNPNFYTKRKRINS
jgi:Papain family cysteine protease